MAVAVCLRLGYSYDSQLSLSRLLLELLESPHERVRYRAAESIARRAQHERFTDATAEILCVAAEVAIKVEPSQAVVETLSEAARALNDLLGAQKDDKTEP